MIPPKTMLEILSSKFKHHASKTVLIKDADHCFRPKEKQVETVVTAWLKSLS